MPSIESLAPQFQTDGRSGSQKMATFHLTTQCNLSCDYCYSLDNVNLDLPEWNAYEAEPMVQTLASLGYRVSLGGGEPTFVPDRMIPLLELCCDAGIPCSVLTNGHLLDEPLLRTLKEKHCQWVQISIDHKKDVELLQPAFEIGRRLGLRMAAGSVWDAEDCEDAFAIYDMLRNTGGVAWRILKRT
ncbi:MAG: radical SAM protein, partial [Planctomycetaceae bacterium]|nr:radical SAM protein [Planctomycetaceae bacterium]